METWCSENFKPLSLRRWRRPTLYTGLNNANAILHVANMVSNIGRLEAMRNGYRFYAEGYTPSAVKVLERVSAERLDIARRLGVTVPDIHQWLLQTYQLGGDTLADTLRRLTYKPTGPYQWTPTPRSMDHKYITEDVPCGLVPMSALGDAVGAATPVIDGLIALSSAALGRDFMTEGRNLESLGLTGQSAEQIRRIFELGPANPPSACR